MRNRGQSLVLPPFLACLAGERWPGTQVGGRQEGPASLASSQQTPGGTPVYNTCSLNICWFTTWAFSLPLAFLTLLPIASSQEPFSIILHCDGRRMLVPVEWTQVGVQVLLLPGGAPLNSLPFIHSTAVLFLIFSFFFLSRRVILFFPSKWVKPCSDSLPHKGGLPEDKNLHHRTLLLNLPLETGLFYEINNLFQTTLLFFSH